MRDDQTSIANDVRENLGVIAAAGEHIEDLHAGRNAEEFQNLGRFTARITRAIGIASGRICDRTCIDCRVDIVRFGTMDYMTMVVLATSD